MILGLKDWTFYLIIVAFLIVTNLITLCLLCLRFRTVQQSDSELLKDRKRFQDEKLILAECEMDGATKLGHEWKGARDDVC